jgi:hypothetical protein
MVLALQFVAVPQFRSPPPASHVDVAANEFESIPATSVSPPKSAPARDNIFKVSSCNRYSDDDIQQPTKAATIPKREPLMASPLVVLKDAC